MPWPIEPEIDEDRQATLRERLARKSDVDLGMYPFKDYPLTAPMLSGCWPVLEWHPSQHMCPRPPSKSRLPLQHNGDCEEGPESTTQADGNA